MSGASNGSRLARARARVYDAPGQEANRKKFEGLVGKALQITEDIIDTGEPSEQLEASRLVLQAWMKSIEVPASLPTGAEVMTEEQRREACRQALLDADVRRFAIEEGWTAPKEKGTSN